MTEIFAQKPNRPLRYPATVTNLLIHATRRIDVPLSGNGSLASMKLLQQQRRVMDGPAVYSSVIDGDAALGHHLLKISESQIVSQIPPHTEQNHRSIKMPALKHLFLRH
jgi:hypothetical protein